MPAMGLRVASAVWALVFFASAVVQYNDPDPIQWMAVYGAAAVISAIAVFRPGRPAWGWPALVAAVAFAWAFSIVPRVVGKIGLADLFATMKAGTPAIEESREAIGLAMVATWMVVLALSSRRRSSR